MCTSKKIFKGLLIGCVSLVCVGSVGAQEKNWDVTPYGSLRLQANYSSVDHARPGADDSYIGFTDAYSRVGVRGHYTVNDNLTLSSQLEVSINLPEFKAEDPTFFDDDAVRVKKVAASGKWGSVWIGKGWLPYYNNIAYPVDMFSSFYSGYATYAYFREDAAVYSSPRIYGFKGTAARVKRTPGNERGYQGVISYAHEGLTLALAVEDMAAEDDHDTYGGAVTYTHGPWYGALKYERYDNAADDDIANIFVSYAADKFTYKAMIADGDLWGKEYTTGHIGVDYQYNQPAKFFVELFYESNNYAILDKKADSAGDYLGGGTWSGPDSETDGTSLAVGVRYDF